MSGYDHSNLSTERLSSTSENEAPGCQDCATLRLHLTDAEAQLTEMAQRVAGLEIQLRRSGSAEVALRNELAKVREEDPDNPDVKRLLVLWRDECKNGEKRIKVTLTGPRPDRVRWAVKKYGVDRIEQSILGVKHDDWAMGRDRRTNGRQYNDIAKHILKDEETIERFEALHLNGGKHPEQPAPIDQATPRSAPQRDASYDPVHELLNRLEHVKAAGDNEWSARCPAHDDRHASLSVGRGRKGVLVHCHTGCTVQQIADALRVPLTDLFAPELAAPVAAPKLTVVPDPLPSDQQITAWAARLASTPKLLERLEAVKGWTLPTLSTLGIGWDGDRVVIPVRDPAGQLVTVARYLPGGKPKMLGLKHRPRGLFPAPETITGTVWLVEGEPDAITGHQLGIGAVSVPGANGWRPDFAQRLAGRDVAICLDCDREGREAAQRIAVSLPNATVIDIDPSRADHYDLTDFAKEGGTVALLDAMRHTANADRAAA